MKKLFVILLVVAMAGCLFACGGGNEGSEPAAGAEGQTYELRLAGMYDTADPGTMWLQKACDEINEATAGAVNITIYPSNQLGDYATVYQEVMMGSVDMGALEMTGEYDPRLECKSVPYLFTGYEDCRDKIAQGSNYFEFYRGIQNDLGVELLGIYCDGFQGLAATELNFDTCMDWTATEEQIMRVPPIEVYQILATDMGYTRQSTIAYAELYTALQTGVAQGWFGGEPFLNYKDFRDVIGAFVDARYVANCVNVVINKATLEGMPQEYQDVIWEKMGAACASITEEKDGLNEQALQDMKDYGIEVYIPTDEEMEAMANHIREVSWPKYEELFGSETMQGLKDSLGITL